MYCRAIYCLHFKSVVMIKLWVAVGTVLTLSVLDGVLHFFANSLPPCPGVCTSYHLFSKSNKSGQSVPTQEFRWHFLMVYVYYNKWWVLISKQKFQVWELFPVKGKRKSAWWPFFPLMESKNGWRSALGWLTHFWIAICLVQVLIVRIHDYCEFLSPDEEKLMRND